MKENKIVLKAPEGINFQMRMEKDGVIVVEAFYENCESKNEASIYNYQNPYIPQGFEYLKGEWEKGFTIRNKEDGSEFTWIPVGFIEPDGTFDGIFLNERFGRRNFRYEEFSEKEYHEEVDQTLLESIIKYGGFYFSSYMASEENGEVVFKRGKMPWVNINQIHAKAAAEHYADGKDEIVSCLPSGAVYDTVFKWIIQTGEKIFEEVVEDSKNWGNFGCHPSLEKNIKPTGSRESWRVCNIYDLAGNCDEWTTEWRGNDYVVIRGGFYFVGRYFWPAVMRSIDFPVNNSNNTSFRAVLYKKA